jgi:hypothetical protein
MSTAATVQPGWFCLRRRCLRGLSVGERYITQVEAARMAGVSKDSVIRARRAGRLAGCRLVEGRWLVPVSALAAAGFATPDTETPSLPTGAAPDGGNTGVAGELAAAQAKLAALADLVARQDDELRFLRQLLAEAIAKKTAS